MEIFADRLVAAVRRKSSPCVVGLDPRIDLMPEFVKSGRGAHSRATVCSIISDFHEVVLDAVVDLIPAVKPQLAFYEQYGLGGLEGFEKTVNAARERGLLVINDGKRNDISSTAEAYANAFLSDTSARRRQAGCVSLPPTDRFKETVASKPICCVTVKKEHHHT
jgi:orotidine-5'-phosphate decarboxylase